jgi:hypothetical protein
MSLKLAAYAVVGAGWAVSAWLLQGQWILILLLGAALGFAFPSLTKKLDTRDAPPRGTAGGGTGLAMSDANLIFGVLVALSALFLWSLFGAGQVYALAARLPAVASGMVNLAGLTIGLTANFGVNRKKLVSK